VLELRRRVAIILVYMIYAVLLNSVGAVILQSILFFGISKPQGSILEGCKDISIATVSFVAASFLPRFGYRRALVIALIIVAGACFAMPLAPSFATAELLFLAVGVTFAVVKVSVYAMIGQIHTDPGRHAGLTTLIEGFFMIGVLSGAWIFAAFVDPAHPSGPAWLRVYWLVGGLCIAAAMLWATTPAPASRAARPPTASLAQTLSGLRDLVTTPLLPPFLIAIFMYVLVEQSLSSWLPTYDREVLHIPVAQSIQIGGLLAAGIALGRLGGAGLLRRLSWNSLLLAATAGAAMIVVASLLAPPPSVVSGAAASATPMARGWTALPWQAFILPLAGVCLGPIYPTLNSRVLSALAEEKQAAMAGLIITCSALGGTFGSFVTGQIFSRLGGYLAFAIVLVPLAALGLCIWGFARATAQVSRMTSRVGKASD
jgi:fucose permease